MQKGTEMTSENLGQLRERLLREESVQQMIRARAYEIYRMRGGQPGSDAHDWFQAEGEVLAFLIAAESLRADETEAEEFAGAAAASEAHREAPEPKSKARAESKPAKSKQASKKTSTKRATSKKSTESKSKPRRTRKETKAEHNRQ